MQDTFETHYGFCRSAVDLSNWRLEPFSRWSFQHVGELVPSTDIAVDLRGDEQPLADAAALLAHKLELASGQETLGDFLTRSSTDALVVMKDGRFVADWHAPNHDPSSRHIVFSISKSLTALLLGIAQDKGLFDPAAPVSSYVPEIAGSAYDDARVQDLLDMRASLDFEEIYLDPMSAYGRYRRAMLWNPPLAGETPETMLGMIGSIAKGEGPHGGPFRYRSPNSDLLALIAERATGRRYAELMTDWVWPGIGACSSASITVDRIGFPRGAGGVSMTPRDLARVGLMMSRGGEGAAGPVVSRKWVDDTSSAGDAEVWKQGDFPHLFADGRYRNQWYADGKGALYAIGIHGQWLYIDPRRDVVIVKASSQPLPVDDPVDLDCVRMFRKLAEVV